MVDGTTSTPGDPATEEPQPEGADEDEAALDAALEELDTDPTLVAQVAQENALFAGVVVTAILIVSIFSLLKLAGGPVVPVTPAGAPGPATEEVVPTDEAGLTVPATTPPPGTAPAMGVRLPRPSAQPQLPPRIPRTTSQPTRPPAPSAVNLPRSPVVVQDAR